MYLHDTGKTVHDLLRIHVVVGIDIEALIPLLNSLLDLPAHDFATVNDRHRIPASPFSLHPYPLPRGLSFWLWQLIISRLTGEESGRSDSGDSRKRYWRSGPRYRGHDG